MLTRLRRESMPPHGNCSVRWRCRQATSLTLLVVSHAYTDQLAVVAREDTSHREGGVRPDGHSPLDRLRRLDQFGAAELVIALGIELGEDDLALLVADDDTVAVR